MLPFSCRCSLALKTRAAICSFWALWPLGTESRSVCNWPHMYILWKAPWWRSGWTSSKVGYNSCPTTAKENSFIGMFLVLNYNKSPSTEPVNSPCQNLLSILSWVSNKNASATSLKCPLAYCLELFVVEISLQIHRYTAYCQASTVRVFWRASILECICSIWHMCIAWKWKFTLAFDRVKELRWLRIVLAHRWFSFWRQIILIYERNL